MCIYIYNSSWVESPVSYAAVGLAYFSLKPGCLLCVSARAWFLWSVAICSSARVTDSCFVHWILYPSHRTDFRYPFDYKEYPPCPNWWYMWRGSVWLLSHNQSTSVRMFPASLEKKSCCPKRRNMLDSEYIYIYIYLYLLFLFIFLAFFSVSVCCLIRSTYSSLCSCCFFANLCYAFHAGSWARARQKAGSTACARIQSCTDAIGVHSLAGAKNVQWVTFAFLESRSTASTTRSTASTATSEVWPMDHDDRNDFVPRCDQTDGRIGGLTRPGSFG